MNGLPTCKNGNKTICKKKVFIHQICIVKEYTQMTRFCTTNPFMIFPRNNLR